MKKSQQQTSRKRSAKLRQLQALNRKRRRWWKATVLDQIAGPKTRAARRQRIQALQDWAMPTFRSAPQRPQRFRHRASGRMRTAMLLASAGM